MRSNKIYLAFLGIVIFLSIGVGVLTRFSYVQEDVSVGNYLDEADKYKVSLDEDPKYLEIYFDNMIDNLSQLKEESDVIVKVRASIERLNYMRAILSRVDVLEVYKGSDVKKGDHIYLYEPSNFSAASFYYVMGGYNIMQSGQEYIVFLKHLKIPEGYRYKGNEAVSFVPISTYYGKYPMNGIGTPNLINEDLIKKGAITYDDVKDFDLITTNKDILAKYNAFKEEVLQIK